ncbi:MAG TPA: polyphosphate kinase 1 [Thermoanaerobaculales bacterium]|nr:polyphosphate kinase 1 [Thermoanaerobaculales bacterium]HPA80458.1 polyphosphate kinase 1 [Thermoanaerobaculales bacterium]HQL30505.1 polyphosphate kinase 1 [Thermoanaerobaculales bacterium]HQN95192.1 polyphosphate kinase 1 [Thermoanaerobaculales bacterium]
MTVAPKDQSPITPESSQAFINRELSWLQFARRVLQLAQDGDLPLLERVKFAGILGMLHDEFYMKRMSGLKRQIRSGVEKLSLDGRTPREELEACRAEIRAQTEELASVVEDEIRPALAKEGIEIRDHADLGAKNKKELARFIERSVLPILTPLAVDAEHPFPFISNLGLNLAITIREGKRERFVRIKVPSNRARWVPLAGGDGFVPLEQVIAANLHTLFPNGVIEAYGFCVTRGAEGDTERPGEVDDFDPLLAPGSIISQVSNELKARRFAGTVRLEVDSRMPKKTRTWLAAQLDVDDGDVYASSQPLRLADLLRFEVEGRDELRYPRHRPITHPRLKKIPDEAGALFDEIRRGDILLHHPYHSFDTSVLRFLEESAADPRVLAIKLTIYRTSSDSPIVRALAEAARRGKQVAVLVEITARFDEAPNIAWGRLLEQEGVHVAYGVEKLKTHVKLALVVREEDDGIRRYVHVGTGNYHTGTARIYEDLGMLTCDQELGADVAAVFNELTGAAKPAQYTKVVVAPAQMRERFRKLIRREAEHAAAGKPSGITAKMNQLQDPDLIRELYRASQAGVPISLNVRGLCCLRAGVPGLSERVRVYSVLGRFLEHGRIYRFGNAGNPEYFIGSADWMKRNLDRRVETLAPVEDPALKAELDAILQVYEEDNHSAWDLRPDGGYVRRRPADGEAAHPSQQVFAGRFAG